MISKIVLKEILLSNRAFILDSVPRIVRRQEADVIAPGKTVIFYGIRRSGKTFILYDIFRRNAESALYLDFEDDRLSGFTGEDFPTVQEAFRETRPAEGQTVYLFDEIQHVMGWERFCRRITERENATVYVTGSSSKLMPLEVDTVIRGRSWSVAVYPFSFQEYLEARGLDPASPETLYGKAMGEAKRLLSEFTRWGGFPEVALAVGQLDRTKLLKEYLRAMFFRDLVERYKMTNIALFDTLADKLFSSFSTRLSLTAFYKQYKGMFPFSKDLLFQYFRNFEDSLLIFSVKKYAESSYTRSRNPMKLYLADTGLCRRTTSQDAGRILENVVFLEFLRRDYDVQYFAQDRECDFVVKDSMGVSAIQVCFELTDENRPRETEGLLEACRRVGATEGLILTDSQEWDETADDIDIHVRPAWRWLLEKPHQLPLLQRGIQGDS